MTNQALRIIPPTGANIGAARLDNLHSELEAHMALAEQHYGTALSNRDAALNANAVGSSSQHAAHLAIMAMNLTVISQNAASLCQQQIQIILTSNLIGLLTADVVEDEEPDLPGRSAGVKPA